MANPFTSKTAGPALPTDFGMQQEEILRQKRMADLLEQQSMEPLEGKMVSGIYVAPSWTQQLAKALNPLMARKTREYAGEQEQQLAQQMGEERATTLQKYADLMRGQPQQVMPEGIAGPPVPEVKPDRNAAIAALLKSRDPMLQQMGIQQQMKLAEGNQGLFSKINPHDYTPESVKQFAQSGDFGSLVPVRKMEVAPSGVAYNPFTVQQGTVFNDPNKLMSIGPNGAAVLNQPLFNAKQQLARAGASNVSVNTAQKPFLVELGKIAAGNVSSEFDQAKAANQTLMNAQQIREGLDKAILGPGANARVTLSQLGQTMGITGKNTDEVLQNTRNVMQGLARQELAAAGQMKGQGQITESERAILRKAESGDISTMTKPEVQTFLSAIEKTARYRIGVHQQNISRLRSDPNAAPLLDYMQVQPAQAQPQPAPANRQSKTIEVDY